MPRAYHVFKTLNWAFPSSSGRADDPGRGANGLRSAYLDGFLPCAFGLPGGVSGLRKIILISQFQYAKLPCLVGFQEWSGGGYGAMFKLLFG